LLERVFGKFEPDFLETLASYLPAQVPCLWTGPSVVSKSIPLTHVRRIVRKIQRPLILWDNYPVNDLSMADELHIGPLTGRDPRLPESVYGYLNNPLLQEELTYVPLATCFDYASAPSEYQAESSWREIIRQRFGADSLPYWREIRNYAEASIAAKQQHRRLRLRPGDEHDFQTAIAYTLLHEKEQWSKQLDPWKTAMIKTLCGL
jgi:hyaluronoglucosaminidase